MPRIVCIVAALLIALAVSSARAQAPLRWKFEAGEEIDYRMTQATKMSMDAGEGASIDQDISQTVDILWKIEEVDPEGTAKIRQNITRVRMSMAASNGASWELDTASDEPPQGLVATLASVFDALVDSDYVVTMTSRGEITDVEAPEKLIETLKNIPGALAGGQSADYIEQTARQSALKLPEGPLEEGETWSTSVKMNAPTFGEQVIETTYKYVGSRDVDGQTMAVFEPSVTMSRAEDGPQTPMQATFKITDSSGEVLFNRDKGRLAASSLNQTMDVEFTAPDGRTIPGVIQQSVKLESKEGDGQKSASDAGDASDKE